LPQPPHIENHFTASETIRDIVIGMSDGLTVPFALAAGLSGAVESTRVIITAGSAEIAAGAIAMGLGGYLAARTDAEHYASEEARERRETVELPDEETEEVAQIFGPMACPRRWRPRWRMRFVGSPTLGGLHDEVRAGLERPDPGARSSERLTIGLSYRRGRPRPARALLLYEDPATASVSIRPPAGALVFGYVKGHLHGARPATAERPATAVVGGLAAAPPSPSPVHRLIEVRSWHRPRED
jgi:hypothetical protein